MLQTTSMQPPTIDDIRAAAERIEGAVDPNADAGQPDLVGNHRRRSLAEVREPAVHRRLQGARRAQQIAAADARGARARRDRGIGRQSRAGGRLSRQAARHSGDDRHAGADADGEGDADRRATARRSCSTATSSTTPSPGRASWRSRTAMCSSTPFDDPQIIAGAGTVGLEMLEDAPDLDTIVVPIGGGGLMSGVSIAARGGQAGHRADRGRGRALSVDEMRDPGLPHAAWAATRWPRALRSSSRAS